MGDGAIQGLGYKEGQKEVMPVLRLCKARGDEDLEVNRTRLENGTEQHSS